MKELSVGESLTGLIWDGVEETPWIAAALTSSTMGGIVVEVPFISHQGVAQFAHVEEWLRGNGQPPNIGFFANNGTYTLIGCQYSEAVQHATSGLSVGRIIPQLSVSALRDNNFDEPLFIETMRSRVDGLQDWTDAKSFHADLDSDTHDPRKSITINFPDGKPFSWQQDAAMMSIGAKSGWESGHRNFTIQDHIFLTSTFESPASFDDHLAAQRKVTALSSLLNSEPCYFREHEIRDSQFPEKFLDGKVADVPFHQAIFRNTFRESQNPEPGKQAFNYSIASLQVIGPQGLEKWASVREEWKRAIDPLVELFRRRTTVEDEFISASLSLEAAGHLLGEVPGESETYRGPKPTSSTFVFRCLSQLPTNWLDCAESVVGLSRALANMYNDLKHFDRHRVPDPAQLRLLCRLAVLTARLVIIKQISIAADLSATPMARRLLEHIQSTISDNGLYISQEGGIVNKSE